MGKSIPSPQQLGRVITSIGTKSPRRAAQLKPPSSKALPISPTGSNRFDPEQRIRMNTDTAESSSERRTPLAEVVADCVKRWFQDTLKEAKNGDTAMQVLVGQMYCSGYGVAVDEQKGKAWINRASRSRSSAWKVGNKRPGYNASDSDSDEVKEDHK